MEFEDDMDREFYEDACKELAEAKTDEETMEALSSLIAFTPDPNLSLQHADRLEKLARQTKSQEMVLDALDGRAKALAALAQKSGDPKAARTAANLHIAELNRQGSGPSELLHGKLLLVRIELAAGELTVAEATLAECERLAQTINYSQHPRPKLAENSDAAQILRIHSDIAETRGESEKVALLKSEIEVLDKRVQEAVTDMVEQSRQDLDRIDKQGRLIPMLVPAAAILWLIYQFYSIV